MHIAMLGTRGIPASYSGFETCVEELGSRLVRRGHEVTVYCRSHHITHPQASYRGMRLVKLTTIPNKYLDTIVHTFLSVLHLTPRRCDIVLMFIAGNSLVSWIPRLSGKKVVLNVDGLDWKRQKWPLLAKKYIQFAEYLATKLPNVCVTDSRVVRTYYSDRFGIKAPYIPYGSEVDIVAPGETLARFGLEAGKYILFVGRLVPENCAHHLVKAFRSLETDLKCVIVGDAPYVEDYIASLKASAQDDPRIAFTGYVFGRGYHELGSNAFAFVETSGVGGTHPALIEAMAFGSCVVVHNTPENLETIGDTGLSYDGGVGPDSLRQVLETLIANPELVRNHGQRAQQRAQRLYSWEKVTDEYERLFYELLNRPIPARLQAHGHHHS